MPEDHFIAYVLPVPPDLLFPSDLKDVNEFDKVLVVGTCVSILDVFSDPAVGLFGRLYRLDLTLEFEILDVDVTHLGMGRLFLHQFGVNPDLTQRS